MTVRQNTADTPIYHHKYHVIDTDATDFLNVVNDPSWATIRMTQAAWALVPLIRELGEDIRGVEVGVFLGINSYMLLESCPNIAELIGVDPYREYQDWQNYITQAHQDRVYQMLSANMPYIGPRFNHIKLSSTEAAASLEDGEYDFVFIDADHSMKAVLSDLDSWWPKLRRGGIMAGHDSNMFSVNFAVTSWAKRHGIDPSEVQTTDNNAWWWRKE